MNINLNYESESLLYKAILSLKTEEECKNFFEDLCTIQELKAMTQRILVAQMLREKKIYTEVVKETGASTATISRVNRALNYGSDGYNTVLDRVKKENDCE